jgi:hypothetical protein
MRAIGRTLDNKASARERGLYCLFYLLANHEYKGSRFDSFAILHKKGPAFQKSRAKLI